ncbi:heterokaryon incompatibility protein-domain-containing protein [Rhodocollybia butyracea]|uniref:Heterokaryon incompatibility protein-domain-containing protein n=1 Tax=Rhodocollybia butyracea TaxID=206335 RepID=A0A9P5U2Q2_9AGAR|nr:heterokaryon incompatibility protein-domain-containing protein [Rhodocollybia butyracea]
MRLLRTTGTDPELIYIANENLKLPKYAILSHVWGDEEVTFQDMQDPLKRKGMKGWFKLVGACELARREDWEYIWIDTCCIDKSSSSELSEAINSMYRYYNKAQVCYAYLEDMRSDRLSRSFNLSFRMCKWFTRGWTLQELIAPKTVFFFTNDWEKIGTKASLQETITEITGIRSEVLLSLDDLSEWSIAARMSWAAGRETTRIEDRAYSLMGIFGVYMPPLYGEGEHAFIRLQEEILKVSDDHTIFAWKSKLSSMSLTESPSTSAATSGILASSPDVFEGSGRYIHPFRYQINNQRPFSMTNKGLLVHLPLLPVLPVINDQPQFLALLNCRSKTSRHLAIYVSKSFKEQYERVRSDEVLEDDAIRARCEIIEQTPRELLFRPWDLPRFGPNDFDSDRIAVFFSGDQGIRPITSNTGLPGPVAASKIADPGDHSMGVFTLDRYLPQTFLFIHDPTHRPFVVVAGKGWLDLVLEFKTEKPNLEDIRQSYNHGKEYVGMRWKNLDRMSKFLTDKVAILIEARRQYQSGLDSDACHVLNVRIVNKIYLHKAPAVLPIRISYAFNVSFSSAIDAGFSLLQTYPNNAWEEWNNDTMNLFLNDATITGTLCFQHEQNRKRFAVTFGVRDKTVWSDVHFLVNTEYWETVKDICNSYRNNHKRSARIGGKSIIYASDKVTLSPRDSSLAVGKWVLASSVHSHVLRNSPNQYKSEIKVTRE